MVETTDLARLGAETAKMDGRGSETPVSNALLRRVSSDALSAILDAAEPRRADAWAVLRRPGEAAGDILFVEDGLVSILGTENGEPRVEVAGVGPEGMIGLAGMLGEAGPDRTAIAISECRLLAVPQRRLRALMSEYPDLTAAMLAYTSARLSETVRLSVCNGRHRLEARLARWILAASARLGSDAITVTHRDLSRLLGVRRASVTEATHLLEGEGAIRSTRGALTVRNRDALLRLSCDCHGLSE